MKFGLFTCPYQRLSLEQAFADAAQFGYDYIELWGGRPHAYAPDILDGGAEEILRLSRKYSMPIEVYTPEHNAYPFNYMMGDERQWRSSMEYLCTSLIAAKMLGAGKMLISVGHSGFAPQEEKRARLLRSLHELANEAEKQGVTIVLETLTPFETDSCTTLSELESVLNELNSPFVQGMCDVVVPFVQGEDPADYARRLGIRMQHLHLVDCDGVSENHLLPGDGIMDLKKTIADFRNAGYDSGATIELVTHYMDDPSGAAEKAIIEMRRLAQC